MKNKKTSMLLAGLMILLYHVWTCVSPINSAFYPWEQFVKFSFFIGVDIFFFLSAFSVYKKNGDIKWTAKKAIYFYVQFIIFTVIYVVVNKRSIREIPLTLSFYNFFTKGGGSFLWFVPAIIITYFTLWLLRKSDDKFGKKYSICLILFFVLWLISALIITAKTKQKQFFIFYSRVPVLLMGYLFAKYDIFDKLKKKKIFYILLTVILVIGGFVLIKSFGYRSKIQYPIYDFFYIIGIPYALGLIMLCDLIPCGKILQYPASATLEMYGLQMAAGNVFVIKFYKLTQNIWATNLLSVFCIIIISVAMNLVIRSVQNFIRQNCYKTT